MIVYHRGLVQAISPTTRQMIWSYPLDVSNVGSISSRPRPPILVRAEDAAVRLNLAVRNSRRGPLRVVNRQVVCVSGRRRLTVLDTSTGEVLWQRNRVTSGTQVLGSDQVVYLGAGPQKRLPANSAKIGGFLPVPTVAKGSRVIPASGPPVALRVRQFRGCETPMRAECFKQVNLTSEPPRLLLLWRLQRLIFRQFHRRWGGFAKLREGCRCRLRRRVW